MGEVSWAVQELEPDDSAEVDGEDRGEPPVDPAADPEVVGGRPVDRPVVEEKVPVDRLERVSRALPAGVEAVEEVEELRTEFSQTFVTDDAEVLATEWSEAPLHFEAEGEWVEIDDALVASGDVAGGSGSYGPRSSSFSLTLGAEARGVGLVALEVEGGGRIVYGLDGAAGVVAEHDEDDPNRLRYAEVLPDVDLELVSVPEGVKDELVLRSADVPDRFVFPLAGSTLTPVVDEESGAIEWLDPAGEVVSVTPPGWMKERDGLPGDTAFSEGVSYTIEGEGDDRRLVLELDRAWLDDPDRTFPVVVDPTVNVTSTSPAYLYRDTYYRQGSTTNYVNDTALVTGRSDYRYHAFLQFGTPGQAAGAMTPGDGVHPILSSTLSLTQNYSRNCQQPVFVKPVIRNWYLHPQDFVAPDFGPLYDSAHAGFAAALPSTSTCPTGGNFKGSVNFPVTALVREFENRTRSNYGMAVVTSQTNDQTYRWFRSSEYGTSSQRPRLTVVWRNEVPNVPTLQSPAADYSALAPPSGLTATYTDNDDDWGDVQFTLQRVAPNGTRTTIVNGVRVGPHECCGVTLPLSDYTSQLTPGRYEWRARAFDYTSFSSWTGWRAFFVDEPLVAPTTPSSPLPASGATVSDATRPTFSAVFRQPQSRPGTLYFQVRRQGEISVLASGSSPQVAADARGEWRPASALATGLYEYRVRGHNAAGDSAYTGWIGFQAGQTPPAPTGLTAELDGDRLEAVVDAPPAGSVAKIVINNDPSPAGIDWEAVDAAVDTTPATAGTISHRSAPLPTGEWYVHAVYVNAIGVGPAASVGPFEVTSPAEYLGWDAYAGWSGGINATLSNYVRTDTDLEVEAIGHPLSLARTYNSRSGREGWFGLGWTSTFEMNVEAFDGFAVVLWPDGRNEIHEQTADGDYKAPKGFFSELTPVGTGWSLRDRDQTVYRFDPDETSESPNRARLTSITTRQGHVTDVAYAGDHPTSITDRTSGRSIELTFAGGRLRTATSAGGTADAATVDYVYQSDVPAGETRCPALPATSATPSGLLAGVYDARDTAGRAGECWSFTYNEGRLTQVTAPSDDVREQMEYDDEGAVIERRVPAAAALGGQSTDDHDNDPHWEITRWMYAEASGATPATATTTDPRGNTTVHHFDEDHRVVREVDGEGNETTHSYYDEDDPAPGLRASTTDPTGVTTTWSYDDRGNKLTTATVADAGGTVLTSEAVEHATFDATNLPTATWIAGDGDGGGELEHVEYRYDGAGNLTGELTQVTADRPAGTCTLTDYTTGSEPAIGGGTTPANLPKDRYGPDQVTVSGSGQNRTCAKKPGAVGTSFRYRSNGDVAEEIDPAGLRTTYTYDQLGRTTTKTTFPELYTSGLTTTYTYDGAGNLLQTLHPATETAGVGQTHQAREVATFDVDGQLVEERVEDAHEHDVPRVTNHDYDDAGRKIRTIDPGGGQERFGYDAAGNLIQTQDPLGRLFHTTFDGRNLEQSTTLTNFSDGHGAGPTPRLIEDRGYDAAGRQNSSTDARGVKTETIHDALDRPRRVTVTNYRDEDGGPSRSVLLDATELNAAGHVTSKQQGTGAHNQRLETFTVAPDGRVLSATVEGGDGGDRTVTYTHDDAGRVTAEVRTGPDGRGSSRTEQTSWTYDAAGRKLTETVENGQVDLTTVFTWWQDGTPASQTSPRWHAEFDGTAGNRSFVTSIFYSDQVGRTIVEQHPKVPVSADGQAPSFTQPVTTTAYDTFGSVTHERDARGHTTVHAFDTMGRRVQTTAPSYTPAGGGPAIVPVESWEYDLVGNRTRHTSRRGHLTETVYDSLNQPVAETAPGPDPNTPAVTVWGYDLAGNKTTTVDPEGGLTTATYDALGRPRTETAWTDAATPGQLPATSPAGPASTLEHTHDDLGGLVASRRLDSDGTNAPAETWRQNMTVDSLGQTTEVTDAAGATRTTTYDLAGRPVVTAEPADPGAAAGRSQTAVYDLAGRQIRTQHHGPDGQLVQTTGASFDADGNQTGWISPGGFDSAGHRTSGHSHSIYHDGAGRPSYSVQDVGTDADGQPVDAIVEQYRFDASGNLTGRQDGRGNLFTTSYQAWDLPEQVTEPAVSPAQDGIWTTRYDAGGLAVAETHPGGIEIARAFNPQGKTLEEAGTSPSPLEPDATRTFGYDRAGRTTELSHPAGQIELAYDGQGRLTTTSTPGNGTAQRRYDPAGRMTGRRDGPSSGWTGFVYDATDRITTVTTDGGAGSQTLDYLPDGRLASRTMADKVQTFTYDALGRQSGNRLVDTGGSQDPVWFEVSTGYDDDGQVAQVDYELPTLMPGSLLPIGANPAAGVHTFSHDQAGRTTSWTSPVGGREVYGWDASHNRTRAGAATYTYDARNRIVAGPAGMADGPQVPGVGLYTHTPRGTAVLAGSEVLLHDALGRQVFQTGLATSYDSSDRPAEVTVATGYLATVVDQLVDQIGTEGPSSPLGDLLGGDLDRLLGELGATSLVDQLDATVTGLDLAGTLDGLLPGGASGLVEGAGVYQMAYNGLELDPATDNVSDYTRMPDGQLATVDPDGAGILASQGWVGTNPHGDVLWGYEPSRGLTSTAVYGPFGTLAGQTVQPLGASRAGFQGDWTDPISGQVHMGARWYRPASATFTARDTYQGELTSPVTANRYLYGNGSPLRHWDLDGHCASDLGQARMIGTCSEMHQNYKRQEARRHGNAFAAERHGSSVARNNARNEAEKALAEAVREHEAQLTRSRHAQRGVNAHQHIIMDKPPGSDCGVYASITGQLRTEVQAAGISCSRWSERAWFADPPSLSPGTAAFVTTIAVTGGCTFLTGGVGFVVCNALGAAAGGAAARTIADEPITLQNAGTDAAIGGATAGILGKIAAPAGRWIRNRFAADAADDLARAPETIRGPYGVRIDPITGRGPMAIDTAGFTGVKTSAGGVRNSRAFWVAWRDRYGGTTLSSANRSLVDDGLSPVVDDVWIRSFPEHADYLGETLVHHHLDMGRHAIPLPYSTHNMRPGFGFWHNGILPD